MQSKYYILKPRKMTLVGLASREALKAYTTVLGESSDYRDKSHAAEVLAFVESIEQDHRRIIERENESERLIDPHF